MSSGLGLSTLVLEGFEMMLVGQDPPAVVFEADRREANEVRWFALDDPAQWAHDRFDPHMARFRDKLLARLGTPVLVG